MARIAFYISGHGFGHVMRMKAVLEALRAEEPGITPFVMGAMPAWIFEEPPKIPIRLRGLCCDIGAVQPDSLRLDVEETLKQNAEFYRGIEALARREAEFLKEERIGLVVGDIPPLAFLAADAAGVKSVAIGNFSWDWIYEGYVGRHPGFGPVVDAVRGAYRRADILLRLPFHGEMNSFRSVRDIHLIARKASIPRDEVRRRLGIGHGEKRKVVFVSMGGHGYSGFGDRPEEDFGDYLFISFFPISDKINQIVLAEDRAGIPHPDIVLASDAVVSKPGYCTVAECIANRTPLIYTSRDDFREYQVMENAVKRYCRSLFMPREDFHSGKWRRHLDGFFAGDGHFIWPEIPTDGAGEAARIILGLTR